MVEVLSEESSVVAPMLGSVCLSLCPPAFASHTVTAVDVSKKGSSTIDPPRSFSQALHLPSCYPGVPLVRARARLTTYRMDGDKRSRKAALNLLEINWKINLLARDAVRSRGTSGDVEGCRVPVEESPVAQQGEDSP